MGLKDNSRDFKISKAPSYYGFEFLTKTFLSLLTSSSEALYSSSSFWIDSATVGKGLEREKEISDYPSYVNYTQLLACEPRQISWLCFKPWKNVRKSVLICKLIIIILCLSLIQHAQNHANLRWLPVIFHKHQDIITNFFAPEHLIWASNSYTSSEKWFSFPL